MNRHPEDDLQEACAGWLGWSLLPPAWFTAIRHGAYYGGGGNAVLRGARDKRMGLKNGVPDLLIISPIGICEKGMYWSELKAPGGYPTPDQKAIHAMLRAFGHEVAVIRSVEELQAQVEAWGIPTRIHKPSTEHIRRGFLAAK